MSLIPLAIPGSTVFERCGILYSSACQMHIILLGRASVSAKRPSAAKMRAGLERLAALDWAGYAMIHAAGGLEGPRCEIIISAVQSGMGKERTGGCLDDAALLPAHFLLSKVVGRSRPNVFNIRTCR